MFKSEIDLFGFPIPTALEKARETSRRKIGYAARPGSGPKNQRCNTCANCMRVVRKGVLSRKCERMAHIWSSDPITDIKPGAPACSEWERRPFKKEPRDA